MDQFKFDFLFSISEKKIMEWSIIVIMLYDHDHE